MKVETRPPAAAVDRATGRRAAVAGGLAAAVALATASLVDAVSGPVPSLVAVVGQAVIRHTPGFLSRGATETRRAPPTSPCSWPSSSSWPSPSAPGWASPPAAGPRVGDVAFAAFGLFAVVCAASLDHISVGATLASATVAAVAGRPHPPPPPAPRAAADGRGRRRPDRRRPTPTAEAEAAGPTAWPGRAHRQPAPVPGGGLDRRRAAAAVLLGGAVGPAPGHGPVRPAGVGRPPRRRRAAAADRRLRRADGFREVEGLSPLVTPNQDFYRIDEALITPSVDVGSWRLRVTGMVDAPFELTYDDLLGPAPGRAPHHPVVRVQPGRAARWWARPSGWACAWPTSSPGPGSSRGRPSSSGGRSTASPSASRSRWPPTAATPWWRWA